MKNFEWISCCLTLIILLNSCDGVYQSTKHEYPTTFESLSYQQIEQKTEEYHRLNDFVVCSNLDDFGYTLGKGCFGPKDRSNINLTESEAIEIAKQALIKNGAYTNVSEPQKLQLSDTSHRTYPTSNEWKIEFHNQVYQDLVIRNTSINVWLNANGVYRIGGHWYNNIVIPKDFEVDRNDALEAAIGYKINYSDWTGPKQLVIDEDMLPSPDTLKLSILPYQPNDRLQLHVVWEFPLAGPSPFAQLYVDIMEGKVMMHKQLVVF